jgi:dynein heavy chain
LELYNVQSQEFTRKHAQAKDYVKFLSTLERQFKNIRQGDLITIEETLPSLLNGLKLVWTISRHINQNEDKMEQLFVSISKEIYEKVKAKINTRRIFLKMKPDEAMALIDQATSCLEKWQSKYLDTKTQIEVSRQGVKRWDFNSNRLFAEIKYMVEVLKQIKDACRIIKQFF